MLAGVVSNAARADAPHDIVSGQVLWLDAFDIYGTDTGNGGGTGPGSTVTMWQDKSPNGFVAGEATSYGATAHDYPVKFGNGVQFNGTSQVLEIPSGIFSGVVNASEFIVGASSSSTQKGKPQYLFWHGPTTDSTSRISASLPLRVNLSTDSIVWDHGGTTFGPRRVSGGWNWVSNGDTHYNYAFNSSTSSFRQEIWFDGVWGSMWYNNTPVAYTPQVGDTFYIGAGYPGSNAFHGGKLTDLIVYSRRLNKVERMLLNNYVLVRSSAQLYHGMPFESTHGCNKHLGGIGKESDGRVSTGTSGGLTIKDVSFLDGEAAGRYVIAAACTMSSGTLTNTSVPTGWKAVSARSWEIQSQHSSIDLGDVNLTFDLGKMGVAVGAGTKIALGFHDATSGVYSPTRPAIYDGSGKISFTVSAPYSIFGFFALLIGSGPSVSASLTSNVVSDRVNGTVNPKAIPGALVRVSASATNSGTGSPDAGSTMLNIPVPANMKFYLGDIGATGSGPVTLAQGAVASGLSYSWSSLSSTTDGLDFSKDAGTTWTYTPIPDADQGDTLITNVRVKLTGTFASGTSPNFPSFTVNYGLVVK